MTIRARLVPALATLAGLALFIHLGQWQWAKADRAEAVQARFASRQRQPPAEMGAAAVDALAAEHGRFRVRGRFVAAWQFFIDSRTRGDAVGVEVVTPLRIEGGSTLVLVDRGWRAWPGGRRELPPAPVPTGPVVVTGRAVLPSTKKPFLIADQVEESPRLWMRPDLAHFAQVHGQPLQPVLLLQDPGDATDGFVRDWPPPEDRSGMHRSYAWQWFGIAGVLLVFHGYGLRGRGRRRGEAGARRRRSSGRPR